MSKLEVQAAKAADALIKHERITSKKAKNETSSNNKKLQLLDNVDSNESDVVVWLVLGIERSFGESAGGLLRPIRLPIPNSWKSASQGAMENFQVCLITKDPQRTYKDIISPLGLTSISRVIGISKLRKKFSTFEARRQLCSMYDLFLGETRVMAMLPEALGKKFYDRKKHPVCVDLATHVESLTPERKEEISALLKSELIEAIESTYLYATKDGKSISIRVGLVSQGARKLGENVVAIAKGLKSALPGGLENVRTMHLKTTGSAALPIYMRAEVPTDN